MTNGAGTERSSLCILPPIPLKSSHIYPRGEKDRLLLHYAMKMVQVIALCTGPLQYIV